ncbi:MAG TPA: pyruvate kinase [Longimicrobiales bacterium]|nr:pyruvate kinase [Longimicrobiales bacterium]
MQAVTQPSDALAPAVLDGLALEVEELEQQLLAMERALAPQLAAVHADNLSSARNLVHYLALRHYDIRDLQMRLARVGLSSLGRSESHVLVTLQRIRAMLALARGTSLAEAADPPVGFRHGDDVLARNARRLLGPVHPQRDVRIVVTLPVEAATDPAVAAALMDAGMDCARINCARGDLAAWEGMAHNVREAARTHGRECRILVDLGGRKLRTGGVPGGGRRLRLNRGDTFDLVMPGASAMLTGGLRRIECASPELFDHACAGQPIWFDDGRIGGVIEAAHAVGLRIRVTHAKASGSKLRPDRGINLPETDIALPALTPKDLTDLAGVVAFADAIELSFAQRESDVLDLHGALDGLGAPDTGVVLKIETRAGFANLPQLLLAAMRRRRCGVMIARGDLAVESGFERLAEVQEEILWIAEAAHMPTIWATQVLDNLAKDGTLTRAEVTDAAMSGRAEAVMLNKGPFITDAIRTLDGILARMHTHQSKKRALFRALQVSNSLWGDDADAADSAPVETSAGEQAQVRG